MKSGLFARRSFSSTLVNVVSGVLHPTRGAVLFRNLDITSTRTARIVRLLVDDAYRKSLLVVAAANNLPGVSSYPAVFTSLVGVDAAYMQDPEDFRFKLDHRTELEAPGVYVEAAWPGGGRKLVTGTSFACPHMSGHIARILSRNRGLRPFQVKTVLYAMGIANAKRAEAVAS